MIQNGRLKNKAPTYTGTGAVRRSAKLVTILGILVFTVFLCSSAGSSAVHKQTSANFGEGVYPVFAPVSGDVEGDSADTAVMEDSSVWSYFESVIAKLIYGDT